VHKYVPAAPRCRRAFGEVQTEESRRFGYPPADRLVVDAYMAHHPGDRRDRRDRQSAFASPRGALRLPRTRPAANARHRRAAPRRRQPRRLSDPPPRGRSQRVDDLAHGQRRGPRLRRPCSATGASCLAGVGKPPRHNRIGGQKGHLNRRRIIDLRHCFAGNGRVSMRLTASLVCARSAGTNLPEQVSRQARAGLVRSRQARASGPGRRRRPPRSPPDGPRPRPVRATGPQAAGPRRDWAHIGHTARCGFTSPTARTAR
jgi:hypothetical protein